MRRHLLLTACFFLLLSTALSQSAVRDTAYADSVRREARRMIEAYRQTHDSINFEVIRKHVEQHGQSLDEFLASEREREQREKRRQWIRIGAGALLLFALFVAIARRSKQRKGQT